MDSDPERVELQAPLPDGALSARVVFKAARLGIDRTVPRSQATHADVERELLGGSSDRRRLERAEAEAYLAEAERFHREVERDEHGRRERVAALQEERVRVAASISVDCQRCGIPRTFEGRRDLLSAERPEHVAGTGEHSQRMQPRTRGYYEYACPRCGSVEFFRHGAIGHPLGGTA